MDFTDFMEMGIFHRRRPISRKISRPWNRVLGWSLMITYTMFQKIHFICTTLANKVCHADTWSRQQLLYNNRRRKSLFINIWCEVLVITSDNSIIDLIIIIVFLSAVLYFLCVFCFVFCYFVGQGLKWEKEVPVRHIPLLFSFPFSLHPPFPLFPFLFPVSSLTLPSIPFLSPQSAVGLGSIVSSVSEVWGTVLALKACDNFEPRKHVWWQQKCFFL